MRLVLIFAIFKMAAKKNIKIYGDVIEPQSGETIVEFGERYITVVLRS